MMTQDASPRGGGKNHNPLCEAVHSNPHSGNKKSHGRHKSNRQPANPRWSFVRLVSQIHKMRRFDPGAIDVIAQFGSNPRLASHISCASSFPA